MKERKKEKEKKKVRKKEQKKERKEREERKIKKGREEEKKERKKSKYQKIRIRGTKKDDEHCAHHPPFIKDEETKKSGGRNWTPINNRTNMFCHEISVWRAQGFADVRPICH